MVPVVPIALTKCVTQNLILKPIMMKTSAILVLLVASSASSLVYYHALYSLGDATLTLRT